MRERAAATELESEPKQRISFFQCPECLEQFEEPGDLGSHLVRHEEVGAFTPPGSRGKPTSEPCPKGCGRYFPVKQRRQAQDLRAHQAICDGSSPLVLGKPTRPKFTLITPAFRTVEKKA